MFLTILIILIALEHLYFLYFEMFAWETIGKKTFRSLPAEMFTPTKALAANQGLYNGFLAAGLVWSRLISDSEWANNIALFFLVCVAVAGIYGGLTASRKIFYVQAVPALIAIGVLLLIIASPDFPLGGDEKSSGMSCQNWLLPERQHLCYPMILN